MSGLAGKYTTKPEVAEAMQWRGDNTMELVMWVVLVRGSATATVNEGGFLIIETDEGIGSMRYLMARGEWLVNKGGPPRRDLVTIVNSEFTSRYHLA